MASEKDGAQTEANVAAAEFGLDLARLAASLTEGREKKAKNGNKISRAKGRKSAARPGRYAENCST